MTENSQPHAAPQENNIEPSPWQTTFNHMWEQFFGPELERRKTEGKLPEGFRIYMAQVLFPENGDNRILFNEEISGEATIRTIRPIEMGDNVYLHDIESIEAYDLPDELLDNGHFTIISSGENWRMIFNFRSGRAKAKDMLGLAKQFLEVAESSKNLGHNGPAVDNLFSSCELICKSQLILHGSEAVKSKTHSTIASAINAWARLGNIDAAFVGLFNELGRLRPNARYGDAASRPRMPDQESFELVGAAIERTLEVVRKATDRPIQAEASVESESSTEKAAT